MLDKDLKKLENNQITLEKFVKRYGNLPLSSLQKIREFEDDFQDLIAVNPGNKRLKSIRYLFYLTVINGEKFTKIEATDHDQIVINFKSGKIVYDSLYNIKQIVFKSSSTMFKRHCSECGKEMNEGYVIEGGLEYYCSETCLNKHYTEEEFLELYDDGEGDTYWTEWEDETK